MAGGDDIIKLIADAGGIDALAAARVRDALTEAGFLPAPSAPPGGGRRRPGWKEEVRVDVSLELSVEGYCAPDSPRRVSGTLAEVAAAIDRELSAFFAKVEKAYDRHGDHRAFCPELGNGYPSREPSMGDVVSVSVIDVGLTLGGETRRADPRSRVHRFLDSVAKGEHIDVPGAVAKFVERGDPFAAPVFRR